MRRPTFLVRSRIAARGVAVAAAVTFALAGAGAPRPAAQDDTEAGVTTAPNSVASASRDTAGVYNEASGTWFLHYANSSGPADAAFNFGPGGPSVTPIRGDWNSDGVDTVGIYNELSGTFFLKNTNGPGNADVVFTFGAGGSSYVPLVGDWNGDGVDTVGLYNPMTAVFFLRNSNTSGAADLSFTFGVGNIGFVPIAGDWDGDGDDSVGLYNPVTGSFFLKNTNAPGAADLAFSFGPAGATPLAGDWDGDASGRDTVGVYVPLTGAWFLRNTNTPGLADLTFGYGPPSMTPIAGGWSPAAAGIAVDAVSRTNFDAIHTATFAHTVGTGANRYLVVGVSYWHWQTQPVSATYNGVAMTELGHSPHDGGEQAVQLWGLLAPASGTHNVVVNFNPTQENAYATIGAISFSGVNQTTPTGTFVSAIGVTTTLSVTVSSAPGQIVLDTVTWGGATDEITPTGTVEWRWSPSTPGSIPTDQWGASQMKPGAASVVMSYSFSVNTWFCSIGAIPIKPA